MSIHDEPDDIDRLFAILEPLPPPPGLLERASAAASVRQERRRRRILTCAVPCYATAILVLIALSFALGRAIADYGAGAILALVLADPRAALVAPHDLALAVAEDLPVALVAALALTAIVFAWGVQMVGGAVGAPHSRALKTGARHG